jgi:hypothetical protein
MLVALTSPVPAASVLQVNSGTGAAAGTAIPCACADSDWRKTAVTIIKEDSFGFMGDLLVIVGADRWRSVLIKAPSASRRVEDLYDDDVHQIRFKGIAITLVTTAQCANSHPVLARIKICL